MLGTYREVVANLPLETLLLMVKVEATLEAPSVERPICHNVHKLCRRLKKQTLFLSETQLETLQENLPDTRIRLYDIEQSTFKEVYAEIGVPAVRLQVVTCYILIAHVSEEILTLTLLEQNKMHYIAHVPTSQQALALSKSEKIAW